MDKYELVKDIAVLVVFPSVYQMFKLTIKLNILETEINIIKKYFKITPKEK